MIGAKATQEGERMLVDYIIILPAVASAMMFTRAMGRNKYKEAVMWFLVVLALCFISVMFGWSDALLGITID